MKFINFEDFGFLSKIHNNTMKLNFFLKQNFIKFAFAERLKVEAVVNNYVKQRK